MPKLTILYLSGNRIRELKFKYNEENKQNFWEMDFSENRIEFTNNSVI